MQVVTTLSFLKCAVAAAGASGLIAAAILMLRTEKFVRAFPKAVTLALLSAVVLTRGAPHNNAFLFATYDKYGLIGLLVLLIAILLIGIVGAWLLQSVSLSPKIAWRLVFVFTLFAGLAAAEPVAQHWNVAQWGDSIFYDRIAVSIARGVMPAGHSYYMPVFQYGPALIYWAFGHFFFVQQMANVLIALFTVPLLALAAWNFFRSTAAVLLVSLLAATNDTLRHAPFLLQIENWYVPIFCFSIWAASNYFKRASIRSATILGIAIGLVFETRTQAGFYVGWLSLAPLWLSATALKAKLRHFALLLLVIAAIATPWTLRNLAVSGRISPIGTQAGQHIVFSNSENNFFGIRRDLNVDTAGRPISAANELVRLAENPLYVLRATYWRSLAFYGLLPPGVWAKPRPRATTWAEMPSYVLRVAPTLALMIAAALGVLLRPGKMTFFLLGAVGANMAIVLFVGFSEPRLSYPITALEIVLASTTVFPPRLEFASATERVISIPPAVLRNALGATIAIAAVIIFSHWVIGQQLLYPPQTDARLMQVATVKIDHGLPDLNVLIPTASSAAPIRPGMHARFTGVVTNAMDPVKWYSFPLVGFPNYTADPRRENYFRAYLLDKSGKFQWGVSRPIGISLAGAIIDRPLLEDEGLEIEGEVLDVSNDTSLFWFRAEKIRHLVGARGTYERFPRK
jgi:4-amino-4-deoxy-L-arabinose transferase-like glycosyltransferase